MAIVLTGTATADSGVVNTTAMTTALPAGAAAGDLAVYLTNCNTGGATVTGPAGWTEHVNGDAANSKVGIWTKALDAGDIAAGTVTATRSVSGNWSAVLATWSGAAFDAIGAVQSATTGTTSITVPSVTPAAGNCLRLALVSTRVVTAATAAAAAPPGSWSELAEAIDSHGTAQRRLTFADSILLSGQAGVAQGTATATTTQNVSYAAYSMTLAPAGATVTAAAALAGSGTLGAAAAASGAAAAAMRGTGSLTATATVTTFGPPPGSVVTAGAPRVLVQAGLDANTTQDPDAGAFILGTTRLGQPLGGIAWVNFDDVDEVLSISIDPGQSSEVDAAGPSRCTIVVENNSGTWDPYNPGSRYAGQIDVGTPIRVRAQLSTVDTGVPYPSNAIYPSPGLYPAADAGPSSTITYGLWRGYVDDIVPDYGTSPTVAFTCSDQLAVLGRVKIPAIAPQFGGELSGQRIARILTEALVPPTLRRIDPGLSRLQPDAYGDWALPLVQRVVDTELGELWVDPDGMLTFYDRVRVYLAQRSTEVQAEFTDTGDDVDMEAITAGRRRGELYNRATVERTAADGEEVTPQTTEDPASVARYGPQDYPRQAGQLLQTDSEALSLSQFIVARFRRPRTKLSDIEVDATVQGMWGSLLPLRRFDRIRVVRDYGPAGLDVQLLVEGIAHQITTQPALTWRMTIATRDIDTYRPFILGVTRLGSTL